uniref:MER3 helicase-like winged helix domain-containing protein n=1 Tax=Cannabis sativa TaxID=3483 RepID=A0A803PD52_CANSA
MHTGSDNGADYWAPALGGGDDNNCSFRSNWTFTRGSYFKDRSSSLIATNQLNVEIVLSTVQNAKEGCSWLGYTYLYVRMIRNPTLNGLESDVLKMDVTLEERRAGLVLRVGALSILLFFVSFGFMSVLVLCLLVGFYVIIRMSKGVCVKHPFCYRNLVILLSLALLGRFGL